MKYKGFVSGLLAGVLVSVTVPAFAEVNKQINAWIQDYVSINVNGYTKALPADMHVLNYQSRIYLPIRFIAESLGADVEYDQWSQRVLVAMPTPEPTPTPEPAASQQEYYPNLPVKRLQNEMTLQIYGVYSTDMSTTVVFDIDNKNPRDVGLLYDKLYIEADGKVYKGLDINKFVWGSPIAANSAQEGGQLQFEPVPKDVKQYIIHIPMNFLTYDVNQGGLVGTPYDFAIHVQVD